MKRNNLILIGVIVLILLLVGVLYYLIKTKRITPFAATEPTLSLEPQNSTFEVGWIYNINIIFDTAGRNIDGVDIHYLHYDPNVLQVQDADGNSANGTQIQTGSLFPSYPAASNSVDTTNGLISISGIVGTGGTPVTGSGVLAAVTFKALATSSGTPLHFDFAPGSTTDCNAIETGTAQDILAAAIDGSYTISGATPTPTPTATSTPTPTPTPTITSTPTPTPTPTPEPTPTPTAELTTEPTPEPTQESHWYDIFTPTKPTPTPSTKISSSPTPIKTPTPKPSYSPSKTPSVSPSPAKLAGFSISPTLALLLYIGIPVLITLAVFFIWWWVKKKKAGLSGGTEKTKEEDIWDEDI